MLNEAIVQERCAFAETLRKVGHDAPTLAGRWTAHDVAAHVVSLDGLGGVPTFVGRTIVRRGLRLNDVAGKFADRGLWASKRRGFEWALEHLEQHPPRLLLRNSVAPIGLFEIFVHHEDVRRADPVAQPRVAPQGLADVLPWLLRYHRRVLRDVRLVVRTPAGEHAEGTGALVTVEGPVAEVVLWLAGRREASQAEASGESTRKVPVLRI
ncbi:MAG TPA: maleylpyruvate isomerase family mycothiol-dependent enzyme [Acidimicrobiales bacterium]|nr:maleylpyruvate isomerase family mycothiol-dependent enzyme [Acidimicrobiales bacterium]